MFPIYYKMYEYLTLPAGSTFTPTDEESHATTTPGASADNTTTPATTAPTTT